MRTAESDLGLREHRLSGRMPMGLALVLSASALGFGYLAHLHGRPVTAALLAILSVTAVGALLGVRAGVLAGVVASIAYNLLFTDPYLQFSVASADDLVPIVALNGVAIVSGLIAGRLRDRAVAAETSSRRIADLLTFSQDLQQALSLKQVEAIIGGFLGEKAGSVRVSITATATPPASLEQLKEFTEDPGSEKAKQTHYLLESGDGAIGELVIEHAQSAFDEQEVRHLLPIVTMATQRCILATEAAEADLIRRSEKFKTALLSSVSHDLRTPLAAISASASSLSSLGAELPTETRDDLLRTIEQQCDRLDRLTTNLLNLGRIDGGLDVDRMPLVDAIEVLGSVLARSRKAHSSHYLERNFRTAAAIVRADEALLEQLFSNVLSNAVTHTPSETVIRVEAARTGKSVSISIEDDGPGIPRQDWDRVFDRFYQGDANGRGRSGSGLGLSIARGFAEAVGGTIHAGRPIGLPRGTRIDINLPLAEHR